MGGSRLMLMVGPVRGIVPHLQRTKLCDMKDGELDPAYIKKREQLKELVTSVIRPKIVQGKSLNGKEFVSFLEQILEALNKGEIPSTGSLVEVFNKGILERCLKLYSDRMDTLSLPLSEQSLQRNHESFREETMKVFDEQHFGRHHAKKSVEKLDEQMEKVYKNFVMANEYQSSKLCEALYTKCEDKMDQLQVLRLPSMAKFNAGFLQCNQSFEMECVGPSKISYERRMMKVGYSDWHFCGIARAVLAMSWEEETRLPWGVTAVQQSQSVRLTLLQNPSSPNLSLYDDGHSLVAVDVTCPTQPRPPPHPLCTTASCPPTRRRIFPRRSLIPATALSPPTTTWRASESAGCDSDDESEEEDYDDSSMRTFTASRLGNAEVPPRNTKLKAKNSIKIEPSEVGKDGGTGGSGVNSGAGNAVKEDNVKSNFTENMKTSGAYSEREERGKAKFESLLVFFIQFKSNFG
ncbi:guanylate-binding family protein [Actinidia rufa]|uniref:Guanylate-binding family protein n=1 Tax=Actinidia rufa TaxID=165716 RepID=A0A7J0GS24_9ERIC|nr:guanylate-binding family protein [Actinidia rufa]